jgi:hypothetical protein
MKNIAFFLFVSGLFNSATSSCSYHLPDSYDTMKNGRAKDSITYLYNYHITYGTTLFATDTINLFTRARKQTPSVIATQGDTLTVLNFRSITKNKKKEEEVWALVTVCGITKHFTAWLPATELTSFTIPNRWTRHVLPIALLQRESSFKSYALYLISFAALLLFGLAYALTALVQKKYKKNAANNIAVYLWCISLIFGIIFMQSLLYADDNPLHHFYYNPNIFAWEELPFLVILLIVLFAAIIIVIAVASIRAFCKFKWPMAIYHTFGYLSIPVGAIPLAIFIVPVIVIFYILRLVIRYPRFFRSVFRFFCLFLSFFLLMLSALLRGSNNEKRDF